MRRKSFGKKMGRVRLRLGHAFPADAYVLVAAVLVIIRAVAFFDYEDYSWLTTLVTFFVVFWFMFGIDVWAQLLDAGRFKFGAVVSPNMLWTAFVGVSMGRAGAYFANPTEFSWLVTFWMFFGVFGFLLSADVYAQMFVGKAEMVCTVETPYSEKRDDGRTHWIHPHVYEVVHPDGDLILFRCSICGKVWKAKV